MSEIYNKAIDNFSRQLHAMQVESAKLNDEHTENTQYYYMGYSELHDEMKEWYRQKARQILKMCPEICIVDRVAKFPEPSVTYDDARDTIVAYTARLHQYNGMKLMTDNGWVKEVKE